MTSSRQSNQQKTYKNICAILCSEPMRWLKINTFQEHIVQTEYAKIQTRTMNDGESSRDRNGGNVQVQLPTSPPKSVV